MEVIILLFYVHHLHIGITSSLVPRPSQLFHLMKQEWILGTTLRTNLSIICEEAWEKGPVVSKYCFEKNVFKVSQIFRRHEKRDVYSIQVLF